MEKERNLGVTEARFALTLLTCLLVAIGYVALLRLGGSKDPSADNSPDEVSLPSIAGPETPQLKVETAPRVLPLDKPDDELANRPASGQKSPKPDRR